MRKGNGREPLDLWVVQFRTDEMVWGQGAFLEVSFGLNKWKCVIGRPSIVDVDARWPSGPRWWPPRGPIAYELGSSPWVPRGMMFMRIICNRIFNYSSYSHVSSVPWCDPSLLTVGSIEPPRGEGDPNTKGCRRDPALWFAQSIELWDPRYHQSTAILTPNDVTEILLYDSNNRLCCASRAIINERWEEVSNKPDEWERWRWRCKGERKVEKDENGDGKKEKEKISIMINKKRRRKRCTTVLYEEGYKR